MHGVDVGGGGAGLDLDVVEVVHGVEVSGGGGGGGGGLLISVVVHGVVVEVVSQTVVKLVDVLGYGGAVPHDFE